MKPNSKSLSNKQISLTEDEDMEILSVNPFSESLKASYNRRRRGYCNGRRKISMKTVRLGGTGAPQAQRSWKMKAVPKLRLKMVLSSPLGLWRKLKNGYLNMMLNLGGSNAFGEKRIPKARQVTAAYSTTEFDNRLVVEIYKSLVASPELATN